MSELQNRKVVITGLGVVTPLGIGGEAFWSAVEQGKNGVGPITLFDASQYTTRFAAEVKDFNPEEFLGKKEARLTDRFVQFGLVAAELAVHDARLDPSSVDPWRCGVHIGSGIGGISTLETQHKILLDRGPGRISPHFIPMMIINMAAGQVSIKYGFKGPNAAAVSACASGAHSIGEAMKIIQRGDADIMLAGGVEAPITPISVGGFCSLRALSTRNDDPLHASRPFDAGRDGFVISEGAGIVVLEEEQAARARGARIYAFVSGYGLTADAFHTTAPAPDGEGARRAMEMAIRDADLTPDRVDYINAHGTSTELNDKLESKAIRDLFGEHASRVGVSSTKSMMGHSLGAAGAIECAATALAIQRQIAPPTINYQKPDPDCDLDYVPNEARPRRIHAALSNSFGFGGHNVCLALTRDGQGAG
jgi:3-oxoacyl-[acyl-carrier-protein] synthase II